MNILRKIIIFLSIIAMAYGDDDSMSLDDVVDAVMGFGGDCEPKPEREHVKQMVQFEREPHQTSKCLRHCLMAQFDMITEGSTTMNKDTAVEGLGMMFPNDKEKLAVIIDECNTANEGIAEKCDNAHAHGMCIYDKLKEKGMDIPEFKE